MEPDRFDRTFDKIERHAGCLIGGGIAIAAFYYVLVVTAIIVAIILAWRNFA